VTVFNEPNVRRRFRDLEKRVDALEIEIAKLRDLLGTPETAEPNPCEFHEAPMVTTEGDVHYCETHDRHVWVEASDPIPERCNWPAEPASGQGCPGLPECDTCEPEEE
jgi:hypothetical protein